MRNGIIRGKLGAVGVCALLLAGGAGCTYLRNRGSDAKQMMDLGFTFSKKPQFGLYANCPMVTPIGYSKVDGYFVGVGGGKLGAGEHHQDNAGVLFWGREKNSWKGLDENDKATTEDHKAGVVGIAQSAKEGNLRYRPACVHYLHLGFVGLMWNLNYHKMADFFCGWFGYIPFGERSEEDVRIAKANGKDATPFKLGPPVAEPGAATPPVAAAPTPAPAAAPAAPAPLPAPAAATASAPKAPAVPERPSLTLSEATNEAARELARDVAAAKAEMAAAPSSERPSSTLAAATSEAARELARDVAAAKAERPAPAPKEAGLAGARDASAKKAEARAETKVETRGPSKAPAAPSPRFTIKELVP